MKKLSKSICAAITIGLPALALEASAAVTYVDATTVNTTVNDTAIVLQPTVGYNVESNGSSNTIWNMRTSFGNGSAIFQHATGSANNDILNTTVSGLTLGSYRVYAYFWDDSNAAHNWDLAAQLNAGGYVDKAAASGGVITASTQTFTVSPLTTESTRTLYAIDLGTFTGTTFTVDAKKGSDVVNPPSSADYRTWYDGVGYQAVPEPNSACLIALAAMPMFLSRRRTGRFTPSEHC